MPAKAGDAVKRDVIPAVIVIFFFIDPVTLLVNRF